MATLPQFQSDDRVVQMMQNAWASQINPILNNPTNNSLILKKIDLISGTTVVPHKLGRKLQGWKIVRQRASASIYDDQDNNQMPQLTLRLISSAAVTVDIEVF
jgi:hypothetical protein